MIPTCLERREYNTAALVRSYPPKMRHRYKAMVYEATGKVHSGQIRYARFSTIPLPEKRSLLPCSLEVRPTVYDYAAGPGTVWHVNFADPQLFVAYGSPLLAQDELQVLEHPALGALREALISEKLAAVTEDRSGPTPVLITGVERRCVLDTLPDPEEGRPLGLYGNRFAAATPEQIRSALKVFTPPPKSNLIAMAAPAGGRGRYTATQVRNILTIAYTAFCAAVNESAQVGGTPVDLRTGFWGCGAFGGNRPLMAALQILAARLAGIDKMVFYAFNAAGVLAYDEGRVVLDSILRRGLENEGLDTLIKRIVERGFVWGESDGN